VRFVFEVQVLEPEVVAAAIAAIAAIIASLIGGVFLVRAARIQASHQHPPELPPLPRSAVAAVVRPSGPGSLPISRRPDQSCAISL
jgi:hypothetical protein